MSHRPLGALEKHAGILIPDSVHDFFRTPRDLDPWTPLPQDELRDLSGLFPNHPLGCVPLFRDAGANEVCLYYRGTDAPLLAGRAGDTGHVFPLDDTPDRFFSDPGRYADDKHGWFKPRKKNLPGWEPFQVTDSGSPIDQLLKPFEVLPNVTLFEKECSTGIARDRKSRTFERLLRRLRDLDDADDATVFFKRAFSETYDLADWFRWYRLGCRLAEVGDWSRSVAALSNARFVALETSPLWSKVHLIAHKLLDALTVGGPLLYQRQVERWMPWLGRWQADE